MKEEINVKSKFTRKAIKKEIKTTNDINPDFDPMTHDKTKYKKPTEKDYFLCNIAVAQKMLKRFCWRPWMEDFINRNGEPLPFKKGIIK